MEPEPGSLLSFLYPSLLASITLPPFEIVGAFVLICLLLLGSALISSSEVAFFSLTHNDFARLREEDSHPAQRILKLKERPRTLLATILISNNFINVAIVIIADFLLAQLLPETVFTGWALSIISAFPTLAATPEGIARVIIFLITVLGVTFLLLLFGEVAPKIYARINNVRIAKFMAAPLALLIGLFYPLSRILVKGSGIIERKLESRSQSSGRGSRDDIGDAIELTVRHDADATEEIDILKSIVKFGNLTVKQIMCSRVDVVAVDENISFGELLRVVKESGYSRIPVFREDFDHVVGILYVKDLLGFLNEPDTFQWKDQVRPTVLFVPEAKRINDMLKEFQSSRMHMAIVVDEYGGTSGIVTLEDILEEVIGDIRDEFDDEVEVQYQQLDPLNFLFEGKTLLNDVCRVIGVETNTFDKVKGDADSLAGLILEVSGQLPKKGSEFQILDYSFKINAVSKRRIEAIQVTLPAPDN